MPKVASKSGHMTGTHGTKPKKTSKTASGPSPNICPKPSAAGQAKAGQATIDVIGRMIRP